eukprot:g33591.t1
MATNNENTATIKTSVEAFTKADHHDAEAVVVVIAHADSTASLCKRDSRYQMQATDKNLDTSSDTELSKEEFATNGVKDSGAMELSKREFLSSKQSLSPSLSLDEPSVVPEEIHMLTTIHRSPAVEGGLGLRSDSCHSFVDNRIVDDAVEIAIHPDLDLQVKEKKENEKQQQQLAKVEDEEETEGGLSCRRLFFEACFLDCPLWKIIIGLAVISGLVYLLGLSIRPKSDNVPFYLLLFLPAISRSKDRSARAKEHVPRSVLSNQIGWTILSFKNQSFFRFLITKAGLYVASLSSSS